MCKLFPHESSFFTSPSFTSIQTGFHCVYVCVCLCCVVVVVVFVFITFFLLNMNNCTQLFCCPGKYPKKQHSCELCACEHA